MLTWPRSYICKRMRSTEQSCYYSGKQGHGCGVCVELSLFEGVPTGGVSLGRVFGSNCAMPNEDVLIVCVVMCGLCAPGSVRVCT